MQAWIESALIAVGVVALILGSVFLVRAFPVLEYMVMGLFLLLLLTLATSLVHLIRDEL